MARKKRTNWQNHIYGELNCLGPNVEDNALIDMRSFAPALRLRMAIGAARRCENKSCQRSDICVRPILECTQRPFADTYDWDYGWGQCTRKEMYGGRDDSWQNAKSQNADD
jgi:hypothetical protein